MFSQLIDLYTKLPEWVKASPVIVVLLLVFAGFLHGDIVPGQTAAHSCDELRSERDLYRRIALKGIIDDEQTAKDSIQKIEQVNPTKKTSEPTALVIKPQPVTQKEKAAVEKPPEATDPATLQQRQAAAQSVLKKTTPAGASVAPIKDKP